MSTTLKQLLSGKPRTLVSAHPEDTVFHALQIMAKNNIGALLVLEGKRLVGIFSERDYARKVALLGKFSRDTRVRDIMTKKVFYVSSSHTIPECMAIMTDRCFRHLPVLDDDCDLIGIVSIGDMVAETLREQQFTIDQLEHPVIDGQHGEPRIPA
ncbi:MAG: CBS domain-containing protein [Betaproteobacteria bacterium]|nr:CBS domain-containing protein [Betaproteobacteria bacterium]